MQLPAVTVFVTASVTVTVTASVTVKDKKRLGSQPPRYVAGGVPVSELNPVRGDGA